MIKISPSILAADFARLGAEADKVGAAGADMLHVDVMDGHFVPNISLGPPVITSLRAATKLPFDVHLMIDDPSGYLDSFVGAGADIVTFHLEAERDPAALIKRIREAGKKPSVSIKPGTDAREVFPYLDSLEMVLVMTVEPGFGGQKLMTDCLAKADVLRREVMRRGLELDIEADGGINAGNIASVAASGVNVFVAGSAVFRAEDPAQAVAQLKANAMSAAGRNTPWLTDQEK
jgi:ribulose-phosphate 3-epimerase